MRKIVLIGAFISAFCKYIGWWGSFILSILVWLYVFASVYMILNAAFIFPCQFNGSTPLLEDLRKDMVVFQAKPTFWENISYMPLYFVLSIARYAFHPVAWICQIVYKVTIQYTSTQEGICQMLGAWLIIHDFLSLACITLIKCDEDMKADGAADFDNKVSVRRMFPGIWLRDHILYLDMILWICFMSFCFDHSPLSCRANVSWFWIIMCGLFWGVVFHCQLQHVGAKIWKYYYNARAKYNKRKAQESQKYEQDVQQSNRGTRNTLYNKLFCKM